ncbi:MAG: TlpA disulfide reductase family protein [Minicystis sp.]
MRTWIALLIPCFSLAAGCSTTEAGGDRAPLTEHALASDHATADSHGAVVPATPHASTPLPAVSLVDFDGKALRIEAAAAGKPALVSFWATWCEACLTEIAALNRLHERVQGNGGAVIGVAVGEPREKAAAFARAHGLRYPQLADEKLELADALGQKRLPATIVLDRQGRVVFVGGTLDEKALAAFRGAMER